MKLAAYIAFAAACFIGGSTLFCQPRIGVRQGLNIDLGSLYEGITAHRDLTIVNTGSDTLRISSLTTSCGCTTTKLERTAILLGDSAVVDVSFMNNNLSGPIKGHVYIVSNDTVAGKLDVTYSGQVVTILQAEPRYVSFGNVRLHDRAQKIVHIQNTTDTTIHLRSWSSTEKRITIAVTEKRIPPHGSVDLQVGLIGEGEKKVLGQIELRTDSRLKPVMKISYAGKVIEK